MAEVELAFRQDARAEIAGDSLAEPATWLEDTANGECIFVNDRMQPEDACLGRDLDVFVDSLNGVAAELTRAKAALQQVTEQHSKLVEELATQYRDAERVGWLSPSDAKKLYEALARGDA